MKHTKGPWSLDKKLMHKSEEMHILRDKNELVAEVKGDLGAAYLIAAAPEMLEVLNAVLEIIVNKVDQDPHFYRDKLISNLRQAIAKAEGRDE